MDARGTIAFEFPFSVIASATDEDSTQSELATYLCDTDQLDVGITIGVAVDMPCEILAIGSPTHQLQTKTSATKVCVKEMSLRHPPAR